MGRLEKSNPQGNHCLFCKGQTHSGASINLASIYPGKKSIAIY